MNRRLSFLASRRREHPQLARRRQCTIMATRPVDFLLSLMHTNIFASRYPRGVALAGRLQVLLSSSGFAILSAILALSVSPYTAPTVHTTMHTHGSNEWTILEVHPRRIGRTSYRRPPIAPQCASPGAMEARPRGGPPSVVARAPALPLLDPPSVMAYVPAAPSNNCQPPAALHCCAAPRTATGDVGADCIRQRPQIIYIIIFPRAARRHMSRARVCHCTTRYAYVGAVLLMRLGVGEGSDGATRRC